MESHDVFEVLNMLRNFLLSLFFCNSFEAMEWYGKRSPIAVSSPADQLTPFYRDFVIIYYDNNHLMNEHIRTLLKDISINVNKLLFSDYSLSSEIKNAEIKNKVDTIISYKCTHDYHMEKARKLYNKAWENDANAPDDNLDFLIKETKQLLCEQQKILEQFQNYIKSSDQQEK